MTETIFMSLTLVLLVYIAYLQNKTYMYKQYVMVAAAGLLVELRETKERLEGKEDDGETQQFH